MIDKRVTTFAGAFDGVRDGAVVLIGGFGSVGQPNFLIDGLAEFGARDLTIVVNNAGWGRETGVPKLMARGLVRKIVCSFPKGSVVFDELFQAGKIEVELVPQGTLAERIRAGGAGVPAFYTPTGVGTVMARGKEVREFNGRHYLLETAIAGDLAVVEAWRADRWGNLTYRGSGRNFNPIMAMASRLTVAQYHEYAELGAISPEHVVTPGVFVDRLIAVGGAAASAATS